MTETDQANAEQQKQQDERREQREQRERYFRTSATDTWRVDPEQFRRLARTGEFTPTPATE